MDRELVKNWINALRSNKYSQARDRLKMYDSYCCLGVAVEIHPRCNFVESCDVMNVEKLDEYTFVTGVHTHLSPQVKKDFGLTFDLIAQLTQMNDIQFVKFDKIADWIEVNILGEKQEINQEAT